MIRFIKNLIARRKAKISARKQEAMLKEYREFATAFGDAYSYAYLGEPGVGNMNFKQCIEHLDKLEEAYSLLGYRIVPFDAWIDYGGYGKSIDPYWLVKREPGERPKFTRANHVMQECPAPSKILEIMELTGKPVEAVRKDDGTYEYRVIE